MTAVTQQDAEREPDNVRLFPQGQPRQYPRSTYTIAAKSPEGFLVTFTLNDIKIDQLADAIATLQDRGYEPIESNPTQAPAAAQPSIGSPPVCPYHGPMKESDKRPGTWYCPKKMADGSGYCKEKYPKG